MTDFVPNSHLKSDYVAALQRPCLDTNATAVTADSFLALRKHKCRINKGNIFLEFVSAVCLVNSHIAH